MKRAFLAGSLALAACGQSLAADLPPAAPPPRAPAVYVPAAPTYNWGGIYLGVNGGYGFGSTTWSDPNNVPTTTGNFNTNGWMVGGTLGANFQAGAFVFGVEGDLDWSNIKGSSSSTFCILPTSAATAGNTCQTKNSYFGTARGRIGFAADRVLIFVTGGAAFADVKAGLTGGSISSATYDTTNKVGWTAGGGIEVAFADNWTGKLEYLYADLGSGTCSTGSNCGFTTAAGANDTVKFTTSVVRVGINYKFGGGH
jgi:outer membrane immunogenic protein